MTEEGNSQDKPNFHLSRKLRVIISIIIIAFATLIYYFVRVKVKSQYSFNVISEYLILDLIVSVDVLFVLEHTTKSGQIKL